MATIKAQLVNMRDGGFISQHDFFIASGIADVMCGGDVEATAQVDEQWLLDLERKFFMQLVNHPEVPGTHDGNDVTANRSGTDRLPSTLSMWTQGGCQPLGPPGKE